MAKSTTYRRRERPYSSSSHTQAAVDDGDNGWVTTLMALGLLLLIIVFWLVGMRTLISFNALFRWLALFAFAGNLLPKKWFMEHFRMDRLEWLWFNLLAVGPMIFATCLLLNFLIHGREQNMLVHGQGAYFDLHGYWQENRALPPHLPWPADFDLNTEKASAALRTADVNDRVFGLSKGLFGYLVISDISEVRTLLKERSRAQ